MAEWFKAIVLKTVVFNNTVGSNPTLSLKFCSINKIKMAE
jgi:hypothetical protein